MPQARIINQRETIDVIAPWYSQERLPEEPRAKFLTLQRRPKRDEQGEETDEEQWIETVESARYKEHVTLYRRLSHGDAKWISQQGNMFRGFSSSGAPKIDEKQMGRLRTMGYLRRVVEMTNAAGEPQPHADERDFDRYDEAELQFLDAAIKQLDDPVAPILHEDRLAAADAQAKILDYQARGVPVPEDQEVDPERYAATQATEHLFRHHQRDLPESGEAEQPALSPGAIVGA